MTQQFPGDQALDYGETGTSKAPPSDCPRCGSTNTKFCYYNNYNKSQPRHFCKSCKRHWTKGGTLRNIPAGRRHRNKRLRTSDAAAPEPRQKHLLNSNDQNNMSDILYQALIRSSTPQGTILESNGTTSAAGLKTQNYINTEDLTHSSFTSVPTFAENVDLTEESSAAAAELWSWSEIDFLASLWDRSDAEMMTPYKPIFQGYYPR